MEHYFNANEIDEEDQKRDMFLSVCGKNIYKLIRDLLASAKPGTKSLADLTKLVKDHRDPVPSEIIQRFKHWKLLPLWRLLRRTHKSTIQASGTNATIQKQVIKVSKSYKRNNSEIRKQGDCYRCGGNHLAADCRFKDVKCHSCKKKGHIAKKCRNRSVNGNLSENHREFKSRFKPRAHFMEQDESSENESESENEVYSVFHFGNKSNEAYKVQINVNECEIAMEIDTGASVSIMSEDTYKEYKLKFRADSSNRTCNRQCQLQEGKRKTALTDSEA
ncbi:unnamed protein product [Mytilus coruscus]|uniref:CCHC-type domain-containing protein n=1 Tax=Mytilus coruscus TaxID=42192 RepID=A0A6J8AMA7_MYTCO|nr:unnamed protein product [Mytilus coruscus]